MPTDQRPQTTDPAARRRLAERIHDAVANTFQTKGATFDGETMPYVRRAWARLPENHWDLPEADRLRLLRETYVTMIEEILTDG